MKFARRIVPVEAFKFDARSPLPAGFKLRPIAIHYSADKSLYYITRGADRPAYWVSVNPMPPGSFEGCDGFLSGTVVQFRNTDGSAYLRKALSFATHEPRSGPVEDISEDSPLVKDYILLMRASAANSPFVWAEEWADVPLKYVLICGDNRKAITVAPGEWIVEDAEHGFVAMPDDKFSEMFVPVID